MPGASTWTLFRCQACGRAVSVRTRRCPRCKAWTGVPLADPSMDRRLESLRAFGIFAGLWTGATAFAFMIGFHELAAGMTGALAVFLIVSHALVPWHAAGWVLAELAWGFATVFGAVGLRHAGWGLLLVIVPASLLAIMLRSRTRYLGRLRGEPAPGPNMPVPSSLPAPGPCASCHRRDAELVAPIYVLSLGRVTLRNLGRFRNLCPSCARFNALPASLFTFFFGWWGIPWGFVWTPQALHANFTSGGLAVDSAEAREIRQRETEEGSEGASGPLAWVGGLFLLPLAIGFAIAPHMGAIFGK